MLTPAQVILYVRQSHGLIISEVSANVLIEERHSVDGVYIRGRHPETGWPTERYVTTQEILALEDMG